MDDRIMEVLNALRDVRRADHELSVGRKTDRERQKVKAAEGRFVAALQAVLPAAPTPAE